MKAAISGSFDPVSRGHADIISRAASLFEEVIVLVGANSEKSVCFPLEKRIAWLEAACAHLPNVRVVPVSGLVCKRAQELGCSVLVRGVRNGADAQYEQNVAAVNRRICGMDTILMFGQDEHLHISSSNIRELLKYGQDIADMVPDGLAEKIQEEYREKL
jgi:pantetheine-phosphate adenylyltransferase